MGVGISPIPFFYFITMSIIHTINKQRSLTELERRLNENTNGVQVIMHQAGIEKNHYTLQDVRELSVLNPLLFRELCEFLYPDLAKYSAPADGKKQDKQDIDTDESVTVVDETGTIVAQGSQSSIDWTSILNGLVATSGGVLTGIFGTRQDPTAAAQLQQQKQDMKTMFIIIAIAVLIIVAFAYLIIKHKK